MPTCKCGHTAATMRRTVSVCMGVSVLRLMVEVPLVKVKERHNLFHFLGLLASFEQKPAVVEGEAHDLLDLGDDLAVAHPAQRWSKGGQSRMAT
jgi:hypothetical protein